MALEGVALRAGGEAASLAERPGATATRRRGQGHEIREIRPFAEGDDPRHIDAAASARSGSPHVRSFHEDRERSLLLIADFRAPMLWGTQGRLRSVAAAQALAIAGWRAVLQGGSVGVVALTDAGQQAQPPRPRHRGMALVASCLERAHALALDHRGPVLPLAPELLRAMRQAPRGAALVVATGLDSPGEGLDQALAEMRQRGPLRLILVEDAFELDPPALALPHLGPQGPAYARFADLPAERAARAARLAVPGMDLRRLAASGEIG
ncbi:MAG: DUF58 domain-containing protein [Paracoccaceae bacterium]